MKEVLSLATFALGVLCFVAFVTTVKPTAIGAIQAAPDYCRTDSSGMRGCDLHLFAAASGRQAAVVTWGRRVLWQRHNNG